MRNIKNRLGRLQGQRTPQQPVARGLDGIDRMTFDSVGQAVIDSMADYAQNEGNRELIKSRMASHMDGADSWANYFTKEKLMATLTTPPHKLLEAVETMRSALMEEVCPPQISRRRIARNQDFGDELNAEQVLTRFLSPWERMTRENEPQRSVTIGVNLTVHCGQRAQHLLWRGAAAVALADILTQRGINVEIVAFWTIGHMSSGSSKVVARYTIKSPDMPLDIGSAAVALSEIAFARLVALYGLARHMPGTLDDCFGRCETLPEADRAGIDYLAETEITSRDAATSWLRRSANLQEREMTYA